MGRKCTPVISHSAMNLSPYYHDGSTGSSSSSNNEIAAAPREIAPFLRTLRTMLETESHDVMRWNKEGTAFEIHDMDKLTHLILPKYFKHSKYASFQRQLNYFHFKKWTKSRANVCTFSNDWFLRDDPDRSLYITRKKGLTSSRSQSFDSLDDNTNSVTSIEEDGFSAHSPDCGLSLEDLNWIANNLESTSDTQPVEPMAAPALERIQPTPYPQSWMDVTAV
ncbi:hypothetical protein LEN26_011019 [Aphanomyces euteiches]|nr:hypothetical protein LEN26_011019 [Aphanomyces euteiches]KAH9127224.1 hypothetical protein AeMF1_002441 [Aphanomyces euteiches]KAH9184792.1 hypothetical protein AeNC1_013230 [Aphanomyces euteiches]